MARIRNAFVRFRTSNWFAASLAIFCAAWMIWNWLPWLPHFDAPWEFPVLVYLLSLEASVATALVYQEQGRADAEFRRFLSDSAEAQARRVKAILTLLEEMTEDEPRSD